MLNSQHLAWQQPFFRVSSHFEFFHSNFAHVKWIHYTDAMDKRDFERYNFHMDFMMILYYAMVLRFLIWRPQPLTNIKTNATSRHLHSLLQRRYKARHWTDAANVRPIDVPGHDYIETCHLTCIHISRADFRLAPNQWETLQRNAVSHWLDANLESAPYSYGGDNVILRHYL